MKDKLTLHWSHRAEKKFLKIVEYIQKEFGNTAAEKFILKIDWSTSTLTEIPEAFPETKKRKNVRRLVISKQATLFYLIKKDSIEIITIFDTRQNPKKLKKDLK